jgi:hypothetical protein
MQLRTSWLYRITYIYLLLPFVIFCLGWLRLSVGLPIAAIMLWAFWQLWKNIDPQVDSISARLTLPVLAITGLWVLLSGVGSYAFQNWDHHWRNAVLRDLITYDWPVAYAAPEHGPVRMLVYYVGYWLPAALTGKLLGWKAANAFLFFWTWLGVLLTGFHLSLKLKASPAKAFILLIAFSGMDALGALFFASEYPTLWPPIQHLEIWGGALQYSSFTTQLFWVFNQAVPAWLCIALLLNSAPRATAILAWSLCFFFAPLASTGLLPYLIIEWIEQTRAAGKNSLRDLNFSVLFSGVCVALVSYLYFSSNTAAQARGWQSIDWTDLLRFFMLEGGLLWLMLAGRLWRNPRWMITGVLLLFAPFVQLGSGRDFVMRASVAPLFYLMGWAGAVILQSGTKRFYRIALVAILAIGALTPFYEINRSLYRTFEYYFLLDEDQRLLPPTEPATHLEQGGAPEAEHPGALTADEIQTLTYMDDKLTRNFIANVRQSLYYRYLAPH